MYCVLLDCQLWEIVEEWKEHCTVTNRTLVLSSIYIHQTKTELVWDFRSPITVKHKQSNFSINGDEISGKVELLCRNSVWCVPTAVLHNKSFWASN